MTTHTPPRPAPARFLRACPLVHSSFRLRTVHTARRCCCYTSTLLPSGADGVPATQTCAMQPDAAEAPAVVPTPERLYCMRAEFAARTKLTALGCVPSWRCCVLSCPPLTRPGRSPSFCQTNFVKARSALHLLGCQRSQGGSSGRLRPHHPAALTERAVVSGRRVPAEQQRRQHAARV